MSKRKGISEEVVREVAAQLGASIVEIGRTGGNHKYAILTRGTSRRKVFFPSTPSDHRGHLNLRCDLRKQIGAMT